MDETGGEVDRLLRKPYTGDELAQTLRRVLGDG